MTLANTIKPSQIFDALKLGQAINATIYLAGPAGCGKSEITQAFADYMLDEALKSPRDQQHKEYLESIRGDNYVDVRLATEAPESVKGVIIPIEHDDGSVTSITAYNGRYPTHPDWVGVIMFDELSSASPNLQATAYQALNDHCIEGLKFPKGALVVGAGNRKGDGGFTFDLLKPVANRVMQYNVEPCAEDWISNYGIEGQIHPSILSLLKSKPTIIYNGDQEAELNAFASGRSWEKASKIVYQMEAGLISTEFCRKSLAGTIGEAACSEFFIHYELGAKLPSIEKIMQGKGDPIDIDEESKSSAEYYIGYSCLMQFMTDLRNTEKFSQEDLVERVDNVFKYLINHVAGNRELHIAIASMFNSFAMSDKTLKIRPDINHDIRSNTTEYREVLREYALRNAELSAH